MAAQLEKMKQAMKYNPPDFRLFEEYGSGLLREASSSLSDFIIAYVSSKEEKLEDYPTWKSLGALTNDLVSMYGHWSNTHDMIRRLEFMDPKERQRHIELDTRKFPSQKPLEQVEDEFAEYSGKLAAREIGDHEIIYATLNRQLRERLDAWGKHLSFAEKDPTLFNPPYLGEMDSSFDYCEERTILEYARDGITALRMMGFSDPAGFDRLEPLPYFETYEKRLQELDVRFRKIIHGRHDVVRKIIHGRHEVVPWADPTYWWHQPEPGQRQ
jgi:hypothetical protein